MSGVGRDTGEALSASLEPPRGHVCHCSGLTPIDNYASSLVLGKWTPSFWEAVGIVKINATFSELDDHWSNVPM